MTDVIDAPAAVKPVNHWIGGKRYEGRSGRSGAVYNPATGRQSGPGAWSCGSSASLLTSPT